MKLTLSLLIILVSNIFAGIAPPLDEKDQKRIYKISSEVFEARFLSFEECYYYNNRLMSKQELSDYKKLQNAARKDLVFWTDRTTKHIEKEEKKSNLNVDPFSEGYTSIREDAPKFYSLGEDGRKFRFFSVKIRAIIKLQVTNVSKGVMKPGDTKIFEFLETPGSSCPHYLALGRIRKHQRYYVLYDYEGEGAIYRYQTLAKK